MHEISFRLVILEVLSNPLLEGGDLTADFAPGVGDLTRRFVKSPVFPHTPGGVGHEIDKCINFQLQHTRACSVSATNLFTKNYTVAIWEIIQAYET